LLRSPLPAVHRFVSCCLPLLRFWTCLRFYHAGFCCRSAGLTFGAWVGTSSACLPAVPPSARSLDFNLPLPAVSACTVAVHALPATCRAVRYRFCRFRRNLGSLPAVFCRFRFCLLPFVLRVSACLVHYRVLPAGFAFLLWSFLPAAVSAVPAGSPTQVPAVAFSAPTILVLGATCLPLLPACRFLPLPLPLTPYLRTRLPRVPAVSLI